MAAAEAPVDVGVQTYNRAIRNQVLTRLSQGRTIPQVTARMQDELEGLLH